MREPLLRLANSGETFIIPGGRLGRLAWPWSHAVLGQRIGVLHFLG